MPGPLGGSGAEGAHSEGWWLALAAEALLWAADISGSARCLGLLIFHTHPRTKAKLMRTARAAQAGRVFAAFTDRKFPIATSQPQRGFSSLLLPVPVESQSHRISPQNIPCRGPTRIMESSPCHHTAIQTVCLRAAQTLPKL